MAQTSDLRHVYFEKEKMNPTDILYKFEKQGCGLLVMCSKSYPNCLLQREAFKENISRRITSQQAVRVYRSLSLEKYFEMSKESQWSKPNGDILGFILAMAEALSSLNISLNPVEDHTYTSLVEKPIGYLCLMDDKWVILRQIRNEWYILEPKRSAVSHLSQTYLHLIIKQLVHDRGLIFGATGGELSGLMKRTNLGQSGLEWKGLAEPKPPDLQPTYRAGMLFEGRDFFTEQSGLHLTRIQSRYEENVSVRQRSRSEARQQVEERTSQSCLTSAASSGRRSIGTCYDSEWPPLDQAKERHPNRRRRAKSTPRLQLKPPTPIGESTVNAEKSKSSWFRKTDDNKRNVPSDAKTERSCCICLEAEPTHALYPCGHQCLCTQCRLSFQATFSQCPICMKPVKDIIKIFKA